jgi:anti-sigma regulatory factor (Ser/Thr protein kinase)
LHIWGSPHELREVLINLVHNAVDAMPSGGQIHLQSRLIHDGDTPQAEVRIVDTGTGMPEEVKNKIFEPFFSTKGERGTGLGLSVSFSIIQKHEGEFRVESRTEGPERGTTFILVFPLHESSFSKEAEAAHLAHATKTPSEKDWIAHAELQLDDDTNVSKPATAVPITEADEVTVPTTVSDLGPDCARILVIDDEENIREILSDILSSDDHEVFTAESGPDGLALVSQHQFDVYGPHFAWDGWLCSRRQGERDRSQHLREFGNRMGCDTRCHASQRAGN